MTDKQTDAGSAVQIPADIQAAPPLSPAPQEPGSLAPSPSTAGLEDKGEFTAFQAGYINSYIALADTKATWTFAVATAMITFLVSQQAILAAALSSPRILLLLIVSIGALGLSALYCFLVILPRLGGSPTGIVYFGSVAARKDANTFIRDVAAVSAHELAERRLQHNFEIARVCRRKFQLLRRGMIVGVLGLIIGASVLAAGKLHLISPLTRAAVSAASSAWNSSSSKADSTVQKSTVDAKNRSARYPRHP